MMPMVVDLLIETLSFKYATWGTRKFISSRNTFAWARMDWMDGRAGRRLAVTGMVADGMLQIRKLIKFVYGGGATFKCTL